MLGLLCLQAAAQLNDGAPCYCFAVNAARTRACLEPRAPRALPHDAGMGRRRMFRHLQSRGADLPDAQTLQQHRPGVIPKLGPRLHGRLVWLLRLPHDLHRLVCCRPDAHRAREDEALRIPAQGRAGQKAVRAGQIRHTPKASPLAAPWAVLSALETLCRAK